MFVWIYQQEGYLAYKHVFPPARRLLTITVALPETVCQVNSLGTLFYTEGDNTHIAEQSPVDLCVLGVNKEPVSQEGQQIDGPRPV